MTSIIKADNISTVAGTGTISVAAGNTLDASAGFKPPAGTVVQVSHGKLSSTFSGAGSAGTFPYDNYFVLPGIQATITPKFANSKILISTQIYAGQTTASSGYSLSYQILKNGNILTDANGNNEGGRLGVAGYINDYGTANQTYHVNMLTGNHVDTNVGTTAQITYSIRIRGYSGSTTIYINRSEIYQNSGTDLNYDPVPQSTITLMEIAQ